MAQLDEGERRLRAVVDHEEVEVSGCSRDNHEVPLALGVHVTAGEECFVIHTGLAKDPKELRHCLHGQEVTIIVDAEGNARFDEAHAC